MEKRDKDWWELYDVKGSSAAARALNAAVARTVKAFERAYPPDQARAFGMEGISKSMVASLAKFATTVLYPVMERHADQGACDTEPRCNARTALAQDLAEAYGWDATRTRDVIAWEVL